jgi:hypothetical protein
MSILLSFISLLLEIKMILNKRICLILMNHELFLLVKIMARIELLSYHHI